MPPARGQLPRRAAAIFDATLTLLAEVGYQRLTIEEIAARSGVHKTTLYRWWPSKDALLGAALVAAPLLDGPMPDAGSLRADLEHIATAVVRLLTSPRTAPVVAAVLAAAADNPVLHEHARSFFADRLGREQAIVDRAIARDELPADVDRTLVFDLIGGAAWLRLILRQQPAGPDFPRQVVDAVLHGLGLPG